MGKLKENIVNRISLECACDGACGELRLSQWESGVTSLSYIIPAWYSNSYGNLRNTVKIIWNLLIGKEYSLYEIMIENNERLKEFKKFVSEMREIEDVN